MSVKLLIYFKLQLSSLQSMPGNVFTFNSMTYFLGLQHIFLISLHKYIEITNSCISIIHLGKKSGY